MAYIMVIDDDLEIAEGTAAALQSAGHEVQIETALEDITSKMETRRPDLVVLDVMFPEDSEGGFTTARAIVRKFHDMSILMLTAVNQWMPLGFSANDIDGNWLPVGDFVEKPVAPDVLCEKVAALLNRGRGGGTDGAL